MSTSFIFGGEGMPKTPQELARLRAVAQALAPSKSPQNVGEGLSAIGNALLYRSMMNKADKGENAGITSANDAFSSLFSTPDAVAPDVAPAVDPGALTPDPVTADPVSPIKSPQDAVDAVHAPAPGFQKVSRAGKGWTEVVGPDGKVIRREGVRNWRNNNPGNLEFGDFAKNAGAIGTDGRFAVFPTYEAGRKAKEKLLFESPNYRTGSIASAITRYAPPSENNTNSYIDAVSGAIGVPPTTALADLTPEQRSAMMDAMQKVEGFRPGKEYPLGDNAAPVEVADNSNTLPASTDPRKAVVDALAGPRRRIDEAKAAEILANPFLDAGKKAVVSALLKRQYDEDAAIRDQQLKKADPKYQMELKKGGLELENLQHPKQARTLTDDEEKAAGLDPSGVYQMDPTGKIATVREATAQTTTLSKDEVSQLGLDPTGIYQKGADGKISVVKAPATPTSDWTKLDDGTLFNNKTGETKTVNQPVDGKPRPFRFSGNSPEAVAYNGMLDAGRITEEQAQDLAAGKTITGPNGEILFAPPQSLIGGVQPQQQAQDEGIDIFGGKRPGAFVPDAKPPVENSGVPVNDVAVKPNPGMVTLTTPKITADQDKNMGFADRMVNSGAIIDEMGLKGTSTGEQIANDWLPFGIGNYVTSEEFQKADQAKRNFINAQLRRESGAVIGPTEFDNANKQYLPQPGDTEEVLKQKAANRKDAINAMIRSSGPTYKAPTVEKKKEEDIQPAPEGVDPDLWQHMTPEERKLWQN